MLPAPAHLSRPPAAACAAPCRDTQFCRALQGASTEEVSHVYEELLVDLYAVQAHMQWLQAAAVAFRREQQLYGEKQDQLRAAIVQAAQDIEDRKRELEEARVEVAQQQEYEAAKREVSRVPARSATRAEMAAVEKEIADLAQQGAALDAAMERRRVQFAAIVHVIDQVHAGLDGDKVEDEAGAGDGGNDGGGASQPMPMQVG